MDAAVQQEAVQPGEMQTAADVAAPLHFLGALAACGPGARLLALDIMPHELRPLLATRTAPLALDIYRAGQAEAEADWHFLPKQVRLSVQGEWPTEKPGGPALYDLALADLSRLHTHVLRVLRGLAASLAPGGRLVLLLPFGWKPGSGYPYIFSTGAIMRMARACQLAPVSAAIVPDETYGGFACLLQCRPDRDSPTPWFDETRHLSRRFDFVPHTDSSFEYRGPWEVGGSGEAIGKSPAATFGWQGEAQEVLVVCQRHPWSGIAEFHARGKRATANLFSWFSHAHAEEVFTSRAGATPLRLNGRPIGADPNALGAELVLHGLLRR